MDASQADRTKPLSQLLREIGAQADSAVSIEQIMARFGRRAFGAVLFVFSTPNLLPTPPGTSTVLGLPLVLIAPQVALGMKQPWLPQRIRRRTVSAAVLARALDRLPPWLERIERVSRPRLRIFFGPVGDRLIGLTCTLLSLVLILPIPFGNMLPAAAVAVLSLALILRDGVLAILGYLLALASTAVLVLAAGAISKAVEHLLGLIGAA